MTERARGKASLEVRRPLPMGSIVEKRSEGWMVTMPRPIVDSVFATKVLPKAK